MKYTILKKKVKKQTVSCKKPFKINVCGDFSNGAAGCVHNLTKNGAGMETRQARSVIRHLGSVDGIHGDDTIAYVDGGRIYYGSAEISGVYLTAGQKSLCKLGAYLLVFPDGVYVNTRDTSEHGYLSLLRTVLNVSAAVVDESFNPIAYTVMHEEPKEAASGEYCLIKKGVAMELKHYDGSSWNEAHSYVKIAAQGIGSGIRQGDVLFCNELSGIGLGVFRVAVRSDDALYIDGVSESACQLASVTLNRSIPEFDFVCVSSDRLVGVRRGIDRSGKAVCKMYASAVNDPFNFAVGEGALEVELNISGAFTGLCDNLGTPTAFTESEIIEGKIKNGALICSVIKTHGMKRGAHKSAVSANGKLYYLSDVGVCEYDGSYPECISSELGRISMGQDGVPAGFANGQYYIKLTNNKSQSTIYIYNVSSRVWRTENDSDIKEFASRGSSLYAIGRYRGSDALILLDAESASEDEKSYLIGAGCPIAEEAAEWMLEGNDIGLDTFGAVRPIRLVLRIKKDEGTKISVGILYGGESEPSYTVTAYDKVSGAVNIPLQIKACDTFRLRISGCGSCQVLGYSFDVREGGQVCGWR